MIVSGVAIWEDDKNFPNDSEETKITLFWGNYEINMTELAANFRDKWNIFEVNINKTRRKLT